MFDSVSRMSRNAEEGFADYQELFHSEVCLVFLKEPHINTEVYRQSVNKVMDIEVRTGNEAVDEYFSGNMELVNKLLMKLAKQQIKLAFEQAEKEVHDLHQRIAEGMRESKAKGNQIGIAKGTKLTTKKSRTCKTIIKTHCKAFGGTLSDKETMKLCGCSYNHLRLSQRCSAIPSATFRQFCSCLLPHSEIKILAKILCLNLQAFYL